MKEMWRMVQTSTTMRRFSEQLSTEAVVRTVQGVGNKTDKEPEEETRQFR